MNPTDPYDEHWTPSTRDVRMSYVDNRYQEWGAEMDEANAEFDRWLACYRESVIDEVEDHLVRRDQFTVGYAKDVIDELRKKK